MFRRADDLPPGSLLPVRRSRGVVPYAAVGRFRLPDVRRLPRPHLWAVAALTLLGGLLRFYRLTFPALWNDETLVFWRVCGTYGQMLVPLRDHDLFPPLHYSLYWLMGHPVPVGPDVLRPVLGMAVALLLVGIAGLSTALAVRREPAAWVRLGASAGAMVFVAVVMAAAAAALGPGWVVPVRWVPAERTLQLTPWVMRSVPALCGTLTVPAMYFMARQLVDAWTSVATAAVTACSAFMLFYSRDAKMYPDAWLLVAVNVGCLLWWFRTGRSTAFLGWVAAGCGMVGLHASTLAVVGLSVLFLFTQRHVRWTRGVLFVLGLGLIVSGPVVYYTKFNTGIERVEAEGWKQTGLGWVGGFFNGDRTGPDHLWYGSTAFLAGYEWPRDDYLPKIEQALQDVPQAVVWELVGVLAVTLLPWPLVRTVVFPRRQAARDAAAPEPAWRVWLWLGAWLAIPTYGIYCHSVDGFVGPRRWLYELGDAVHPAVWAVAIGVAITGVVAATQFPSVRPAVWRTAGFWAVTAALFGGCCLVYSGYAYDAAMHAAFSYRPWQSIWEPRYLGFMWPAAGVGVAALLMRLPTRPVRVAAVTFFCLANLLMAGMRMRLWTEPPIDRLAADTWAAQDRPGQPATVRTYDNLAAAGIAVAQTNLGTPSVKIAGGRYYLQMLADRQPMSPDRFEQSLSPAAPQPYTLRQNVSPAAVKYDLRHVPDTVDHVVIWTQMFAGQRLGFDPYRSSIPPGWRLASEDVYPVRVIWDWREYWKWVRREYVRPPPPPSPPPP